MHRILQISRKFYQEVQTTLPAAACSLEVWQDNSLFELSMCEEMQRAGRGQMSTLTLSAGATGTIPQSCHSCRKPAAEPIANFDKRLTHALPKGWLDNTMVMSYVPLNGKLSRLRHVNFGRRSKDDGLLHVVDLNADACHTDASVHNARSADPAEKFHFSNHKKQPACSHLADVRHSPSMSLRC